VENDKWTPTALFILAIVFIIYSLQYKIGSINAPGVSFFPLVCATGLAILSVALLVKALRPAPKAPDSQTCQAPVQEPIHLGRVIAVVTVMVLFALLHSVLGFWVSVFVAMVGIQLIAGVSNWKWAVFGGVATTALGYLVFERWMGAYFPAGAMVIVRSWLN
jgi:cell division protein FtsW (lipid II flippase)